MDSTHRDISSLYNMGNKYANQLINMQILLGMTNLAKT